MSSVCDKECAICLDKIKNMYITECIHFYDLECIYRWVMTPSANCLLCPNCKMHLNKENMFKYLIINIIKVS